MWIDKAGKESKVSTVGPNLRRGTATVMATLPEDVGVGDIVGFIARTKDTRTEFENRLKVTIFIPSRTSRTRKTKQRAKNCRQGIREGSREAS